jgi:uncharacterized membrane protein YeaQ/YmgE (transglycosylase-associated protein family)
MSLIAYLIAILFTGLIVGALARLALPGRDPMSIPATIGIGIAGSLIAGLIYRAITDGRAGGGIVLSVLAATVLVYFVRRSRGGSLTRPHGGPVSRRDAGPFGGR